MRTESAQAPRLARAGAVFYVVWGLMHLGLGVSMVADALEGPGERCEAEAESLMFFVCAAVLGLLCCLIAVTLNRVNDPVGYWLNLVLTVPVDLALLLVLIPPGHVDAVGGSAGPIVMAIAIAFSTAALLSARRDRRLARSE